MMLKLELSIDELIDNNKFKKAVAEIQALLGFSDDFRMRVCSVIVSLKEDLYGGGFSVRGSQERFLVSVISDRIGLTHRCLFAWLDVYQQLQDTPSLSKSVDFNQLSFSEKTSVVKDIRVNKKKFTAAVKDHYASKDDPVKKKIFYLERYVRSALSTVRGLSDLDPTLSLPQIEIINSFKKQSMETTKIINEILVKNNE